MSKDITKRIKTFEDACEALGNEHPYVKEYLSTVNINITQDLISYLQLRIITEALNEGWRPTFDKGEYRYYPWFFSYTKEEYDKLDEDEKKKCRIPPKLNNHDDVNGYLEYVYAGFAGSYSYSNGGVRLTFKTKELAKYCGEQFIDIWINFLFKSEECK